MSQSEIHLNSDKPSDNREEEDEATKNENKYKMQLKGLYFASKVRSIFLDYLNNEQQDEQADQRLFSHMHSGNRFTDKHS